MANKAPATAAKPARPKSAKPAKPVNPRAPDEGTPPDLPPPFAGFDRFHMQVQRNAELKWLETLYHRSVFNFRNHYLATRPRDKIPDDETKAAVDPGEPPELWKPLFPDLERQGWGFFLVYTVLSQRTEKDREATAGPEKWRETGWNKLGPDDRDETIEDAAYKGFEHAEHVKKRNSELDKDDIYHGGRGCQGAVVFIDNEDPRGDELLPPARAYYEALLRELRRVDPDKPDEEPVRVGFYARPKITAQILPLAEGPLHLWNVFLPSSDASWSLNAQRKLLTPYANKTINAVKYKDVRSGKNRIAMSLGRQFMINNKACFPAGSPFRDLPTQCGGIDYDVSMVRDPRYPLASPRLGLLSNSGIVLHGFFDKSSSTMRVTQCFLYTDDPKSLHDVLKPIEPEAPLILVPAAETTATPPNPNLECELFTITLDGKITHASATRPRGAAAANSWTWSLSSPILGDRQPQLRRSRALSVVRPSATKPELQLFFIARNHNLIATRRLLYRGRPYWTDPAVLGESTTLHPFSHLTVAGRGTASTNLFFQDRRGTLCTVWCPTDSPSWPGPPGNHSAIESSPSFFLGSALASVAPSETSLLVLGLGPDYQLRFTSWSTATSKWSASTPVIPPDTSQFPDGGVFLFPHTQIAAYAASPVEVYVAAISEGDVPVVFLLKAPSPTVWQCVSATLYPIPPKVRGKMPASLPGFGVRTEDATGWCVNPYGDVWVGQFDNGYRHLFVAGCVAGKSSGLMVNISKAGSRWTKFIYAKVGVGVGVGAQGLDEEKF
ncbi:hypothetical protein B0T16DRAFT_462701 [Cercophora newfieldiana]|uniref:Uncharacterized protein n=1 Tax=Cercophora newfieldiana TaxID=92897 RepID=A0AA39XRP2_9PEZI|nr:hypothetical protein B0T16DRAFT_462701 [Cercophora newfieldiana]